jgi:cell division control protein 6
MTNDPTNLSAYDDALEDPTEDPLFNWDDTERNAIFNRKELLKVGHVPESARIVGRDHEIEAVAAELRPIVQSDPPNNVIIYGKTGTGKSLVAKHVTERARRAANAQNVSAGAIYIDCAQHADTRRAHHNTFAQRSRSN